MPVSIRGTGDRSIDSVADALSKYEQQHPAARIDVYRQNSVSIRVRIVDQDFDGTSRADRHEIVWRFLAGLPEKVQSQVSLLLTLTPKEIKTSFANLEFDNPIPSSL
jgi:stress-induced morphogen